MTALISQEHKKNSAPMSQFEGAAEMATAIKKNQQNYYPSATPIAPPLVLGTPVLDSFFLSTREGKFVEGICKWLVQQGQVAEGKITKMYEVINTYLALGTCAGQAKTFLLHRRLEQYDGKVFLQEKVSSIFFQTCQKLQVDIEHFRSTTKIKHKQNARHLLNALKKMMDIQHKIKELANEYWKSVSCEDNAIEKVLAVADKVAYVVNQEKVYIKKAKKLSQKIQKLKKKDVLLKQSREEAENQIKKISLVEKEYWKEKRLGVIAKESYSRKGTQKGFSFFASQKLKELSYNNKHESLYMIMEYENSIAHAILFQPSLARVFDLQAGVVEYKSKKEFFYDFKRYLMKTKCYRVFINVVGTVIGNDSIEIV